MSEPITLTIEVARWGSKDKVAKLIGIVDGEGHQFQAEIIRVTATVPPADGTSAGSDGDYFCPNCDEYLDGSLVTFEENCDTCGVPVQWHTAKYRASREAAGGELSDSVSDEELLDWVIRYNSSIHCNFTNPAWTVTLYGSEAEFIRSFSHDDLRLCLREGCALSLKMEATIAAEANKK